MANPQTEDGYTRIANELMEALAKIRIPGEAMKVLLVILRKTYGFQKKEDSISLSQFCLCTGMKKPAICKALHNLNALNVITQKDNGSSKIYGINKDFDSWNPLPKKITVKKMEYLLPKKITVVTQKDNETVTQKVTHKRNKDTKETITKEKRLVASQASDVKTFIDYAFQAFNQQFGEKLMIDGPKDGSIVKKLLNTYGLEKLKGLWDVFMQSDDQFVRQAGYSIGIFKIKINKLLVAGKPLSVKSKGQQWLERQTMYE